MSALGQARCHRPSCVVEPACGPTGWDQGRTSASACEDAGQAGSRPHNPEQIRARHSRASSPPSCMQRCTSSPVGNGGSCCNTTSRAGPASGGAARRGVGAGAARPRPEPATCETSASSRSTSGSRGDAALAGRAAGCAEARRWVGVAWARLSATAAGVTIPSSASGAAAPVRSSPRAPEIPSVPMAEPGMPGDTSRVAAGPAAISITATLWSPVSPWVHVSGAGACEPGAGVPCCAASAPSSIPSCRFGSHPPRAAVTAVNTMGHSRRIARRRLAPAPRERKREEHGGASMHERMLTGPWSRSSMSSPALRGSANRDGRCFAPVVSWFKPLPPSYACCDEHPLTSPGGIL